MRTEISGAAATGSVWPQGRRRLHRLRPGRAGADGRALYHRGGKEAARYDRRFGTDEATRVLARAQEIIAARKAGGQACGEAP